MKGSSSVPLTHNANKYSILCTNFDWLRSQFFCSLPRFHFFIKRNRKFRRRPIIDLSIHHFNVKMMNALLIQPQINGLILFPGILAETGRISAENTKRVRRNCNPSIDCSKYRAITNNKCLIYEARSLWRHTKS